MPHRGSSTATLPDRADHSDRAEGRCVAIVDDSEIIRAIVGHMLRDRPGADVVSFSNGAECLRWMESHHCDLLIADYHMEGLNGLDLARLARKQQPRIRMLILTIDHAPEVALAFLEAGASAVLHKPVDTELLRRTCESLLERPESTPSAR